MAKKPRKDAAARKRSAPKVARTAKPAAAAPSATVVLSAEDSRPSFAAAPSADDTAGATAARPETAATTAMAAIATTGLATAIKAGPAIAPSRLPAVAIEAASALVRQRDAALVAATAIDAAVNSDLASQSTEAALAGIRARMSSAPGAVPGAYTVRVVGVRKTPGGAAPRRHPLPAVPVQLATADAVIVTVIADAAGVALLRPPPEFDGKLPEKLELQVLGSDGKPAARARLAPSELGGAGRLIEVAETAALSVSFEYGNAWLAAEDAAVKRAAELKTISTKALPEHQAAIKLAIANIDETLSRILSTNKEAR